MTRPLRAIAIDDEPPALRRLAFLLEKVDRLDLVGSTCDSREGLAMVREKKPDLLFLDIRMPEMDGLEVAEALTEAGGPTVVFTTAFARHAIKAFDLRAVDYLLKPIRFERLAAAVERARDQCSMREAGDRLEEMQRVIETLRSDESDMDAAHPAFEQEIWAPYADSLVRVPVDAIIWVQAERDYVRLHTAERSYLLRARMGQFEGRLDPRKFRRMHRSALVRLDAIQRIHRTAGGDIVLVLTTGTEVAVGPKYASGARDLIRPQKS